MNRKKSTVKGLIKQNYQILWTVYHTALVAELAVVMVLLAVIAFK
jgi:hypothetical protein